MAIRLSDMRFLRGATDSFKRIHITDHSDPPQPVCGRELGSWVDYSDPVVNQLCRDCCRKLPQVRD